MQIRDLIDTFDSWNSRHRAPSTVAFYLARLKKFRDAYIARGLTSLTPLEINEHRAAPTGTTITGIGLFQFGRCCNLSQGSRLGEPVGEAVTGHPSGS